MVRKPPSIIPLEDYDECINMLIYGDSGVGKTVFGGSAPNTLMLGVESGLISAKRRGSTADAWIVPDFAELERAYIWLRDNPSHGYNWVTIDSLTDMQEKLLRDILDRVVADSKGTRDPDIPAIQDHQKWQNKLKRFINKFNDLPVNICWTALEMRREDEEGENIILPLLLGKDYQISQIACGKMHIVGHMEMKVTGKGDTRKTKQRIQFEHIPPYFAKDRFDCLPRYLLDATIPKIEEFIKNSGGLKIRPARSTRIRTTARRARRTER